jgi:hypothetical protein
VDARLTWESGPAPAERVQEAAADRPHRGVDIADAAARGQVGNRGRDRIVGIEHRPIAEIEFLVYKRLAFHPARYRTAAHCTGALIVCVGHALLPAAATS